MNELPAYAGGQAFDERQDHEDAQCLAAIIGDAATLRQWASDVAHGGNNQRLAEVMNWAANMARPDAAHLSMARGYARRLADALGEPTGNGAIEVPDDAVERLFAIPVFDSREQYEQHARLVAAPVVCAELHRLAIDNDSTRRWAGLSRYLRARAAEIAQQCATRSRSGGEVTD